MFIIPRYLLRQFVQVFVICFLSFTGLYIVIDAFGHLDHFSSYAEKEGNLLGVMARYYGYHSLSFFDRTSGILAMISAIFTVAWLARHQELTALMAAGISKLRLIRPLLLAAAGVSLLGAANRELVIPRIREELTRDTKDLSGGAARDLEPRFDAQTGILIGGEKLVLGERRIINPVFILSGELAAYGRQLAAANAYHVDANADHPAGLVLTGVTAPKQIGRLSSLKVGDRAAIITPRDAPWLGSDEAFVASELEFQLLANGSSWRSFASTAELIDELRSTGADPGAGVRVAVHTRLVQFLMDGTLVMLGLPVMMSRRRRNAFLSIGICLGVATAFTLTCLACQSLGNLNLVRPSLAAWLPLMAFVPVAAAMSQSLRS
jgi:lipopolysaccharide export system permease protein